MGIFELKLHTRDSELLGSISAVYTRKQIIKLITIRTEGFRTTPPEVGRCTCSTSNPAERRMSGILSLPMKCNVPKAKK